MNLVPTLTDDDATAIVSAALAAATDAGVAVTIAVVDLAGVLIALSRMNGARAHTVDLASRKARTSAAIGISTTALETIYRGKPTPGDVMTMPGGVPVLSGKLCAGAIGVSGATGEVDEAIAQAGVRALPPG